MGGTTYSTVSRDMRATSMNYATASVDVLFSQNQKRQIHSEMDPVGVVVREARDSEVHPLTTPVQIYLDVTGSMTDIPANLIRNDLPTLISGLIQEGLGDVTLMFGAIGDHEVDTAPLQVGQFESGDEELDHWLTSTWLEGGGGGNGAESYLLAWYFAGYHTITDSFVKRGQKGIVITIGDEPTLNSLPKNAVTDIMGTSSVIGNEDYTAKTLLEKAQEENEVYHINLKSWSTDRKDMNGDNILRNLLGQNYVQIDSKSQIIETLTDIIMRHYEGWTNATQSVVDSDTNTTVDAPSDEVVSTDESEMML